MSFFKRLRKHTWADVLAELRETNPSAADFINGILTDAGIPDRDPDYRLSVFRKIEKDYDSAFNDFLMTKVSPEKYRKFASWLEGEPDQEVMTVFFIATIPDFASAVSAFNHEEFRIREVEALKVIGNK